MALGVLTVVHVFFVASCMAGESDIVDIVSTVFVPAIATEAGARTDDVSLRRQPVSLMNLTLGASVVSQLEYEFGLSGEQPVARSKITLALISGLGLGWCGIDRCFMGLWCLGSAKLFTLAGCGIWFLMDLVLISVNMFYREESIDILGYRASFGSDREITIAFWLTLGLLFLQFSCTWCGGRHSRKKFDSRTRRPR
mmetsp:Transcript_11073/g.30565  ORF Transcript_11073/g.30565 Transcript_11073/m.30565 type:complete len:197 (-) Transcript_11073:60-650(-)